MNLDELRKLATSAPFDYMAVNKETGYVTYFDLFDVVNGQVMDVGAPGRLCDLSTCHICAFTGFHDSEGDEVYGGHILQDYDSETYWLVHWDSEYLLWTATILGPGMIAEELVKWNSAKLTIVGHIDQPAGLPEEVREVLK